MTVINKLNIKIIGGGIALFLATLALLLIVGAGSAKAAYTDMPLSLPHDVYSTGLQFVNLSNAPGSDPETGGGAAVPISFIKVYSDNPGATTINFGVVVRAIGPEKACENYNIEWTVVTLNSSGGYTSYQAPRNVAVNGCTIGPGLSGGYSFTIDPNLLSEQSGDPGHAGIYSAVVRLRVVPTGPDASPSSPHHVKSATLRPSTSGNVRIGYAAGTESTTYPSFNSAPPAPSPTTYGYHRLTWTFAQKCNATPINGLRISWVDDDYGTPKQSVSPRAVVTEYNRNGGPTGVVFSAVNANYAGAGEGSMLINVRPDKAYQFQFQNVQPANGIKFNVPFDSGDFTIDCSLSVSCTIAITAGQLGGAPGPAVAGGRAYNIQVKVTNNGSTYLPATIGASPLQIVTNTPAGGKYANYPPGIAPGTTYTADIGINAPGGMNDGLTISGDVGYPGVGPPYEPVAVCNTVTFDTYLRYDFNATVGSTLDNRESPTKAYHNTSLVKAPTAETDVDSTSTRRFYKRVNTVNSQVAGPFNDSRSFVDVSYSDIYNIAQGTHNLGDQYCADIFLARGHGWRGLNNKYIEEGPTYAGNCQPGLSPPCSTVGNPNCCPLPNTCSTVTNVINKPYVRTYGEDVAAGGGFGGSCSRTNAGILAFMRPLDEQRPPDAIPDPPSDRSGSGAQLAAMALGPVSGFTSANMRNGAPTLAKGLTFAHDPSAPDTSIENPLLGGNMEGNGWCMPDFFTATQFTDTSKIVGGGASSSMAPISVIPLSDQQQTIRNIGGAKLQIIGNPGPSYTRHHTIYIDGDAFITGDIKYNGSYAGGILSIPSFTLVVKGNIYIHKDVSQLDGLYIAQPNPGRPNTGRIYTCANDAGDAVIDPALMYSECGANESGNRRQLTVNGSFLAERIVLNRTGYSLRDSRHKEPGTNSKAAEVFNFSPEMYLSPPVFKPDSTSTSGEYQYLAILAPFL